VARDVEDHALSGSLAHGKPALVGR
jgi:hypothetical protein